MKKIYKIGFLIFALIISQQIFPQKENTKSPLTGEQQIELSEGYSFISSRINAENPNLQDILQNNLANLEFVRNSAGLMLRKIGPNWVNSIGDWVNTEGYLFKMSSGDDLIITGDVIDPQTPVELSIGYQIIGYLPDEAFDTEDVFQDVLDNLEFVRNTAGLMLRKIGPVWVNSIGDMQPGEGYLVKMTADDVLIYPASSSFTCGDPFTDPRDEQTYNTVQIGDQCWMAENLNIGIMINVTVNMSDNGIIEKYCYDNDPANCETYGGLYQWNEIMEYTTTPGVQGICPVGWYIPTDDEWTILTDYLGGEGVAGGKMKEAGTTHWSSPNLGATNESGFTGLPGGYRYAWDYFNNITYDGTFWSSSEDYGNYAWSRFLSYFYACIEHLPYNMLQGFSVRCLKDDSTPPVNQPPVPPSSPTPENGAEYQTIEVDLSWTCTDPDGDPLTYDVYFGTVNPPPLVATGQTETTFDPGTLENIKEYFWMIVAHDDHSNSTTGPVWSFTTEEGGTGQCGDPFTDPRDGQTYNTVQIGDQCWMAENLNIGTMINGSGNMSDDGIIEKYCYDNNTANCDEYGGLYQWNEMMQYTTTQGVQGICPVGWYISTDDEWKILEGTVDSQYPVGNPVWDNMGWRGFDAGMNMKSANGWYNNGNGTDLFGFAVLPVGYREYNGIFSDMGNYSRFWTSTEHFSNSSRNRQLIYSNDDIRRYFNDKDYGYSVRCLKDGTTPLNQPPEPPSSPNPEDGAENQSIEADLSWTCTDPEEDPITYDVYFGIEATPPQITTGQTETTYDPGTLENNTEYFWKIVAHDDHSNTTEGPVWSFTTEEGGTGQCGDPFIDPRDGQTYNTVQIGDQCWMAENLNIGTMINGSEEMTDNSVIEKYCYDNSTANCDEYGGLYEWNEAMQYTTAPGVQGVCPAGWYIPIDDEWKILEGTVDSQYPVGDPIWNNIGWRGYDAGLNLKSTNGWNYNGNGSGLYNYEALPGGCRYYNGNFYNLTYTTYFWSSSEDGTSTAWERILYYNNDDVSRYNDNKSYGFSVRCLQD